MPLSWPAIVSIVPSLQARYEKELLDPQWRMPQQARNGDPRLPIL